MARFRRRDVLVGFILSAWLGAAVLPVHAQDDADAFYKGKTVRLVVGSAPGGGYDLYDRMIAPYVAKALGTTVVVENEPGAGGIRALDNLTVAPPDGLQILLVNGAAASLSQLLGLPGVRYDLGKVGHLGTVSISPWIWLVGPNSPIGTAQDALSAHKKMSWAAIGGLSDGSAFACAALSLDCQFVLGYAGGNEAALALKRGETDAIYDAETSANRDVRAGQARAIAAMGRQKSRFFPDTPTIFEALPLTADQQWLLDFRSMIDSLGRIYIVPPNLPPARLAYLQAIFRTVLTDPALIAEGEKNGYYIGYIDAERTRQAAVNVVDSISAEQREKIKSISSMLK